MINSMQTDTGRGTLHKSLFACSTRSLPALFLSLVGFGLKWYRTTNCNLPAPVLMHIDPQLQVWKIRNVYLLLAYFRTLLMFRYFRKKHFYFHYVLITVSTLLSWLVRISFQCVINFVIPSNARFTCLLACLWISF